MATESHNWSMAVLC